MPSSPAPGQASAGSLVAALYAQNVPQALLQGLAGVPQVGVMLAIAAVSKLYNIRWIVIGTTAAGSRRQQIGIVWER